MISEANRQPRRICLSIHTRALEILKSAAGAMLATEALKLAKAEYDARWKRPR